MSESTNKRMPVWLMLLIVFLVFAVIGGGIGFVIYKLSQKPEQTANSARKSSSETLKVGEMMLLEPGFQNDYTAEISDDSIVSVDPKSKIATGLSGGQASVTLTDSVTGEVMVYLFSVSGDTTAAEDSFKIVPDTPQASPDAGNQHLPTGIALSYSVVTLNIGETKKYPDVTITPEDAANKMVVWSSSDSSVAAPDDFGNITGVSPGDCIITAVAAANTAITSDIRVHVNAVTTKAAAQQESVAPPVNVQYYEDYVAYSLNGDPVLLSAPSSNAKVIKKIPQNTIIGISLESYQNGYFYAMYNQTGGYISDKNIDDMYNDLIQEEGDWGYITTTTGESVNLREKPTTDSKSLCKIPFGASILTGRTVGLMRYVEYNNRGGFVMDKFVTYTNPNKNQQTNETFAAVVRTTTGQSVNLRSKASTSGSVLIQIPNGTTVTVVSREYYNNEWLKVTYKGKTGYIRQDLLSY